MNLNSTVHSVHSVHVPYAFFFVFLLKMLLLWVMTNSNITAEMTREQKNNNKNK